MKYQYVGDGLGVPGLPHQISEEEAKELGLESLLHDAIENGNYKPVNDGLKKESTAEIYRKVKPAQKESE